MTRGMRSVLRSVLRGQSPEKKSLGVASKYYSRVRNNLHHIDFFRCHLLHLIFISKISVDDESNSSQ
jgi:hypothetical protein